jgi:hypothetical protein
MCKNHHLVSDGDGHLMGWKTMNNLNLVPGLFKGFKTKKTNYVTYISSL